MISHDLLIPHIQFHHIKKLDDDSDWLSFLSLFFLCLFLLTVRRGCLKRYQECRNMCYPTFVTLK